MSPEIQREWGFFFICVATGILIMFGYDILRAWRRAFSHGSLLLAIEDFIYWSCVGILSFCVIFLKNSGVLRGFSCAGILLGMLLYYKSVSSLFVKIMSWIIRLILRILLFPVLFLTKKIRKKPLKVLKKHVKRVKMAVLKSVGSKQER